MTNVPLDVGDRVAFVVGARRSGTNWLQRVLGAHPDVALVPSETYLFSDGLAPLRARFHQGPIGSPKTGTTYLSRSDFQELARAVCDRVFGGLLEVLAPDARYLVERTPWHVYHLELIAEVYPRAPVLHIVRDGRDVARSLLAQDWSEAGPRSVAEAAREWSDAIGQARAAAPTLERYIEVRYEDLLADPAARIADLFEWLGLSSGPDVVHTAMTEAGVRFNVDTSMPNVGSGKWRDGLSAAEVASFHAVAGPVLAELGYEADDSPTNPATPTGRTPLRGLARTVPHRLTAAVRSLPSSVRDRRRAAHGGPDASAADVLLQTFDRFVGVLHDGDRSTLPALVTPAVRVAAEIDGERWEARGPEALDRLVREVGRDDHIRGRQLRGDLHPGVATFTAVQSFATPSGARLEVVVVAHVVPAGITHVTYYRYPLGGGA